ncbi:MAG: hypothetical protein ACM3NT_05605 [Methylocystaceae bacterium]
MPRRRYLLPLLVLAFWLLSLSPTWALEWGEVLVKEAQQGPLLLTGARITSDANISGDVYLVAEEVTLRGTIKGDVFCLAQKVTVNGRVEGDIRLLGGEIELNGPCTGTVTALGNSFWLWQEASCGDTFLATSSAQINGKINGRLRGQTDTIYINGTVNDNTDLRVNKQLTLGSKALLQNGLNYQSPVKAKMETGAVIKGETDYKSIPPLAEKGVNLTAVLISWLAALIIWWLAGLIKPDFWQPWGYNLAHHPWISLFIGTLSIFVLPPLIMLLVLSVIGIPAALLLTTMAVMVGYLGRIVVAVGFSVYIAQNMKSNPGLLTMIILIPLILLTYLPGVGIMFVITYGCLGLGSLIFTLRFYRHRTGFDQII